MSRRIAKELLAYLPPQIAEAIETESRQWFVSCQCGHKRSVWEAGGVRYKAMGNPRRRLYCPKCCCVTWHQIHRENDPDDDYAPPT